MRVIITIIFCFISSMCFAISDEEFQKIKSESELFIKADKDLDVIFKRVLKIAKGSQKKQIIQDQKNWLESRRDEIAKEFTDAGLGRKFSYYRATIWRINELRATEYGIKHNGNGDMPDSCFFTDEDNPEFYMK